MDRLRFAFGRFDILRFFALAETTILSYLDLNRLVLVAEVTDDDLMLQRMSVDLRFQKRLSSLQQFMARIAENLK